MYTQEKSIESVITKQLIYIVYGVWKQQHSNNKKKHMSCYKLYYRDKFIGNFL